MRTVTRPWSPWPWLRCVPTDVAEHADRFEAFYAAYPRHEAPKEAWAAWKRLGAEWSDALAEAIAAGLEAHRASAQWLEGDRAKIPHPATWLNQRRWEGEPPPPPRPGEMARPISATDARIERSRAVVQGDRDAMRRSVEAAEADADTPLPPPPFGGRGPSQPRDRFALPQALRAAPHREGPHG